MAAILSARTVADFGFGGINLRDPEFSLPSADLVRGENLVVDESGRLSVRNGFVQEFQPAALNGLTVKNCILHLNQDGYEIVVVACSDFRLYASWDDGQTFTQVAWPGGYTAPTSDNWQLVSFEGRVVATLRGQVPLKVEFPSVGTATATALSAMPEAHVALAAFGRVWFADTETDKATVTFSDILDESTLAGTVSLYEAWKSGDKITALQAFQDTLVIFCTNHIIIYQRPDTIDYLAIREVIPGMGCIGRDAVAATGSDLVFVHNNGIHALSRAIASGYQPSQMNVSGRVDRVLTALIKSENFELVRSFYSPALGFVIFMFNTVGEIYIFDPRGIDDKGAWRSFKWTFASAPTRPRAMFELPSGQLYGVGGFGVYLYKNHADGLSGAGVDINGYAESGYVTFENSAQINALKKATFTLFTGPSSRVNFTWFNEENQSESYLLDINTSAQAYSEYGIAEFGLGEYGTDSRYFIQTMSNQLSLSGRWWKFFFEMTTSNDPLAMQNMNIFHTKHRIY